MRQFKLRELFAEDSPAIRKASIVIVLFGVFLLSFIWIELHFKVQSEREDAINQAFKDTANFARVFEEHTLSVIKSADQTALYLKSIYEKGERTIDIQQYMSEQGIAEQPFVLLSLVDENGDMAVTSQEPFVPANLADREHFLVHKNNDSGQLFISKPVLGRVSGKWSIQMTRRVNKPDGTFGGVAVVSVDPFYFSGFYKDVYLGKQSSVDLIGRDGIVRASKTDDSADLNQNLTNSQLMKQLTISEAGNYIATSSRDGVKRLYSYRALDDYPFVVAVGVSEMEVFRALNERVIGYYWLAGTTTAVIGIFIIMLLVVTTQQKRTEQVLKQARDSLEVTVEKRTQELFAVNQELSAMNEELRHTNQELENEIADRKRVESTLQISKEELQRKNSELIAALLTIQQTQKRFVQQEKLAGIGQLAAGVAHEINNPLGFVSCNVETLARYFTALSSVLARYRQLNGECLQLEDPLVKGKCAQAVAYEQEQDLDYILEDLPDLFQDTTAGLEQMSKIVKGMRHLSRIEQQQSFEQYDLLAGLESSLLVVHNKLKHCAVVEKRLSSIPAIEAIGSQIDQVLLNLIVNAAQAIKTLQSADLGVITITTWHDAEFVYCAIEDSGIGIAPQDIEHVFNPFFTTKPVGQGTGMGLSISYDIVVNHHQGEIWVKSILGQGAKFTIKLPIKQNFSQG